MSTIISIPMEVMPLRELLERANVENPQFRPICGFQAAFEADASMLSIVTAEAIDADEFDMIYSGKEVEVYLIQTQRTNGKIKLFDVKFIGDLIGYEEWIVVQGLIAVTRLDQLSSQYRQAKMMLIKAMEDIWGVNLKKGA